MLFRQIFFVDLGQMTFCASVVLSAKLSNSSTCHRVGVVVSTRTMSDVQYAIHPFISI